MFTIQQEASMCLFLLGEILTQLSRVACAVTLKSLFTVSCFAVSMTYSLPVVVHSAQMHWGKLTCEHGMLIPVAVDLV